MDKILLPGEDVKMAITLKAWVATAQYTVDHAKQMKVGEKFTIEGTDGKKLVIYFK